MSFLMLLAIVLVALLPHCLAGDLINGAAWNDDQGNRIEAHGGGFLLDGSKYYWYGETQKTDSLTDHGVNCYSSTDLISWHFENRVLYQQNITGVSEAGPYVVERPKVVYNGVTKQYVMWFHLDTDNYGMRQVGIATSSTPNGAFKFVRGFQPDGIPSLDMTLYQDDDGSVYHIRSANNQYVAISALSDDFMNTTGVVSQIGESREGPAMFKFNKNYYLVTSHLSGWSPNEMELFVGGDVITGAKWQSLGNPTGSPNSYDTQSTNVLLLPRSDGQTEVVYQGDRWNYYGPGGLLNATYVWLPMQYDSTNMSFTIPWVATWSN